MSELIQQLIQQSQHFLALLEQEKRCLQTPNEQQAEQLLALVHQKNTLIQEIDHLTQQLFQTVAKLSTPAPNTLSDLLTLPELANEHPQIQHLLELSQTIQQKNQQNGLLIQALNRLNQQALQILKGQSAEPPTIYTAQGTQIKAHTPSSLGKC